MAVGATLGEVTVKVALLLVTVPAALVTVTEYVPALEVTVDAMEYVELVAPEVVW